ncbi:MAG: hypothetical protein ABL997_00335 [Planctomycetota bacterium]
MPTKTPSKSARKPKAKKPTSAPTTRTKAAAPEKDEKASPRKASPAKAEAPTATKSSPSKSTSGKSTSSKPSTGKSSARGHARAQPPAYIPRAMPLFDDEDDVMGMHGAGYGAGFGRCGGRMLGSALEQNICDRLGHAGVAHSHSPRHFEVSLQEKQVAAYAPMIVLRGRGREGKSVVVESIEDVKNPIVSKIIAFRRQYGQEYYVILISPDEVLDVIELATYDEACATTDVSTLIARLAE